MQTLNKSDIEHIFKITQESIQSNHSKSIMYLQDMKPLSHETDNLNWRYRLDGFLHGMVANDAIDEKSKTIIVQKLLGIRPVNKKDRPGRSFQYSVDIFTEQGRKYSFDVPSQNPTDAYFQLTKRTAYKSIPDINLVEVFSGLKTDRGASSKPAKIFPKNDLIFVYWV